MIDVHFVGEAHSDERATEAEDDAIRGLSEFDDGMKSDTGIKTQQGESEGDDTDLDGHHGERIEEMGPDIKVAKGEPSEEHAEGQ